MLLCRLCYWASIVQAKLNCLPSLIIPGKSQARTCLTAPNNNLPLIMVLMHPRNPFLRTAMFAQDLSAIRTLFHEGSSLGLSFCSKY
ncbi:hypothetical protein BDW69DRAFT_27558 [Aspergillus filifer]